MRTRTAAIVGFVVSSLVPTIVFALFTPVAGRFDFEAALGALPVFFFFSALVTALLGVPSFLVLFRLRLVRWWSALATGLSIGILVGLLLRIPNAVQVRDLLVMGTTGGISALAFWFVWSQRSDAPD
jgi:hypothetical protein